MIALNEKEKNHYASPVVEIELFNIECLITTSGGQGQFDDVGGIDSLGDLSEAIDSVVVDTITNDVKALMDEEGNAVEPDILDSEY